MGESNTSEVLKSARKQKVVWGYVESVAVSDGDRRAESILRSEHVGTLKRGLAPDTGTLAHRSPSRRSW